VKPATVAAMASMLAMLGKVMWDDASRDLSSFTCRLFLVNTFSVTGAHLHVDGATRRGGWYSQTKQGSRHTASHCCECMLTQRHRAGQPWYSCLRGDYDAGDSVSTGW